MLIGYCSREVFKDTAFSSWWEEEYNSYQVDTASLLQIKNLSQYKIMIVMGTWCGDSRREVPRFYKILDYLKFPQKDIALINVNRNKKTLREDELWVEVKLVPTFYIFKKGEVIGQIVETPQESLEKDLLKILK
jgi:thiol-disulfide isomerase/thioredoxin